MSNKRIFGDSLRDMDKQSKFSLDVPMDIAASLTFDNLSEQNLLAPYHHNDFLKIWIFVDGPKKVVETTSKWLGEMSPSFAHKCLYCAYLYNNKHLLEAIENNYMEIRNEVLTRYLEKVVIFNSIAS